MTVPFAIGDELLASALNDLKMTFTLQKFTSAGTWIKPDGLSRLYVEVVGGGGSGGGVGATGVGQAAEGSGAGGGGYARKLLLASALASTETVDVGAGGAVSGAGGNGNTGGNSIFATGKAYAVTGNGGGGGIAMAATTLAAVNGAAGGSGAGGDVTFEGSDGGNGFVTGGIPVGFNNGGASFLSALAVRAVNVSASGKAGKQYGGGSTGAVNGASQAARASLAGASGIVIVWNCF